MTTHKGIQAIITLLETHITILLETHITTLQEIQTITLKQNNKFLIKLTGPEIQEEVSRMYMVSNNMIKIIILKEQIQLVISQLVMYFEYKSYIN